MVAENESTRFNADSTEVDMPEEGERDMSIKALPDEEEIEDIAELVKVWRGVVSSEPSLQISTASIQK
jgi:hypothetical protein